jgi:chromosome segregation ATPase
MEAKGYALKGPTSSAEMEALKAALAATQAETEALKAASEASRAEMERLRGELAKAEEATSSARANLTGLRTELDKAQALAEAKARESFLLEQALLRLPLALGTGSSWWQKARRKKATEAEKKAALEALKGQKPSE